MDADADDRPDGIAVGGDVSPEEAFSHVANETRFDILRALWAARNDGEEPTGFSALRRRSGVEDSGQFNYHLDQLTPRFVRKVDDGYWITEAGRRVVGAVASGVYTDTEVTMEPRPVGDCIACEGTLVLEYEEGVVGVECRGCETLVTDMPVPPVLVATHDPAELPEVLAQYLLTEFQRLHRGFCLYCGGPMTMEVHPVALSNPSENWNVEFECRTCGNRGASVVTATVIDHPAVASLFHDAGVDVRDTPLWDVDALRSATEEVASEDPVRIRVTLETDAGTLTLTVDEDLDVVATERRE